MLNELSPGTFTKKQYIRELVTGAYIAAVCLPKITYNFIYLSQFSNHTDQGCKDLNKTVKSKSAVVKTSILFS